MREHRAKIGTVFLIVFIDLVGFGIVIPILPLYAEEYGPSPVVFGLLAASTAVTQVIIFRMRSGRAGATAPRLTASSSHRPAAIAHRPAGLAGRAGWLKMKAGGDWRPRPPTPRPSACTPGGLAHVAPVLAGVSAESRPCYERPPRVPARRAAARAAEAAVAGPCPKCVQAHQVRQPLRLTLLHRLGVQVNKAYQPAGELGEDGAQGPHPRRPIGSLSPRSPTPIDSRLGDWADPLVTQGPRPRQA